MSLLLGCGIGPGLQLPNLRYERVILADAILMGITSPPCC